MFYSVYPEEEKERGLHAFAPHPPKHIQTFVSDIWDFHIPTWRAIKRISSEVSDERFQEIKKRTYEIEEDEVVQVPPGILKHGSIHGTLINRWVSRRRGKWDQIP